MISDKQHHPLVLPATCIVGAYFKMSGPNTLLFTTEYDSERPSKRIRTERDEETRGVIQSPDASPATTEYESASEGRGGGRRSPEPIPNPEDLVPMEDRDGEGRDDTEQSHWEHGSDASQVPDTPYRRPLKLCYKQRLILRGHKRGVAAVKFSPDGKWLASCCRYFPVMHNRLILVQVR